MQVTQLGGEVGDIGLKVSGVHPWVMGSALVLFLRWRSGTLRPLAMGQGIFRIHRGPSVQTLERNLDGIALSGANRVLQSMSRAQSDRFFASPMAK